MPRPPYEPSQDAAAILAEDVRGDAREAWLLDDGRFLVIGEVDEASWASRRWRMRMRQRRVLRMFVPASELAALPRIERGIAVARRAHEICDASEKYREWREGPVGADPDSHAAKGAGLLQLMLSHARVILSAVPERLSPFKVVPYNPPPIRWEEPAPARAEGGQKPAKPKKG